MLEAMHISYGVTEQGKGGLEAVEIPAVGARCKGDDLLADAVNGGVTDREADKERDMRLGEYGIRVIRYTNRDINKNMSGVTTHLLKILGVTFDELKKRG